METPIVTKEDFDRGSKAVVVRYRWGQEESIALRPLPWRDLFEIGSSTTESGLKLLLASLPAEKANEKFLDTLTAPSLATIYQTAQALNLGVEDVKKNPETPDQSPGSSNTPSSSQPNAS